MWVQKRVKCTACTSHSDKFKSSLDKQGYAGAILMDLSNTLNPDLLLGKLNAYGFDKQSVLLIKSYLTNR